MRKVVILSLFALFLILVPTHFTFAQNNPPHNRPGPMVDTLQFKAFAQEIAAASLEKGEMDIYFGGLKTSTARELATRSDLRIYRAPASFVNLVLNPAPAREGELNPFSIKKVRQAMNYIVDRDFVTNNIYSGNAESMFSHLSTVNFDYATLYDIIKGSGVTYDHQLARNIVEGAMIENGAVSEDGKWFFKGKPVRIKFVIRVEDERRELGDLITTELEKLGFTVDRGYTQFGSAIQKVYGTNPQTFDWHIYTEGWGRGSIERYDFASLSQMCAPWFGNMPGWKEVGFWQYENEELDVISQKIFRGEFRSLDERNILYGDAVTICMNESVRIWVASITNSFPADPALEGLTTDLVAGPRGIWTFREGFIPNRNNLVVGHLWVWTPRSIWNPVGGFGDVYSADIFKNVNDPPTARHPFTGMPIPFRVGYNVETAGPRAVLSVPEDAFIMAPNGGEWRSVGGGVTATSKVTLDYGKYFQSKWHNGQPITMADVIYGIYQNFDLTYNPDKTAVEFAIATTNRPILDTFKGFKILDENRLDVYVNFWHFDSNYIAEYSSPTSLSMPWELLAAMDTLVFEKRQAAYSDTAAARFQVDWLSLTAVNHARLVRNTIREFSRDGAIPEKALTINGVSLTTLDEALERYSADMDWFEKHQLMVISNGPFKLMKFDPPSQFAQLEAFRDPSYPFKPGTWNFGTPEFIDIEPLGDTAVGVGETISLIIRVSGPGQLGLNYLLIDPTTGDILLSGNAESVSQGQFNIRIPSSLTSTLDPGLYQLSLATFSSDVSYVVERTSLIDVTAEGTSPRATATPTHDKTDSPTTTATPTPSPTTTQGHTANPPPTQPVEGNLTLIGVVAGAVILVVVAALLLIIRKRSKAS